MKTYFDLLLFNSIVNNAGNSGCYLVESGDNYYVDVTDDITTNTDFSQCNNAQLKKAIKKHGVTSYSFVRTKFYFLVEFLMLQEFLYLIDECPECAKAICNRDFSYGRESGTGLPIAYFAGLLGY
jgi:hypothetical protein